MKKTVLIHFILISSLLAATGFERGVSKIKYKACDKARKEAYLSYRVFQMNPDCRCEKADDGRWMCDIYFQHMGEKK